jgi:hypothetical protein
MFQRNDTMTSATFGHQIENLYEGLTVFNEGAGRFVPMKSTEISIEINAGLATIKTQRVFRNNEDVSIEAILTMPVGFDAVVTGLTATIDGRKLTAIAKTQSAARDDYEEAIDNGKMAVLHEETLKGVHTLSVAQLAPGKEVKVEIETVTAMGCISGDPFLRLPTTAGHIYGTSPLMPADDLIMSSQVEYTAKLSIVCDQGKVTLNNGQIIVPDQPIEVKLNQAIELRVVGGFFGTVLGRSAYGQSVKLELTPAFATDGKLDVAILVDRSGSTSSPVGSLGATVWSAMRDGLASALSFARTNDQISLWQFDNTCEKIGSFTGSRAGCLIRKLGKPNGGTELAGAVKTLLNQDVRDILVLTDGETWAHEVDELKSKDARISAILVGNDSLDANIGHLCAMTGGQVFYAPGDDVTKAISAGLTSLRGAKGHLSGELHGALPQNIQVKRAGVEIDVTWQSERSDLPADAVGRYAASTALPLLDAEDAKDFAEAHALCSHMTSLVLVDEAGDSTNMLPEMRKVPLMESVNYSIEMSEPFSASSASYEPDTSYSSMPAEPVEKREIPEPRRSAPRSVRFSLSPPASSMRFGINALSEDGASFDLEPVKNLRIPQSLNPAEVAANIDWDQCSNRFLTNQISDLSRSEQELVRSLASSAIVIGIARELNEPTNVVALALLAKFADENDRAAQRFAKRILGSLDQAKLEDVLLYYHAA